MKKGKKVKQPIKELPKTQSSTQVVVNVKPIVEESINELPGYEKEDYNIYNNTLTNKSVCWNCCHTINNNCISQPIKFENGVFSNTGNFCSYACICRYIVDSNETSETIFSKLSILNLFVDMQNKSSAITITPAPPRLVLKMFGGPIDIEEYRNYHNDYLTLTNVEPIIKCVDISIKNLHIKKKNMVENKKEFKLYRKNKKSSTNDIYASMNLISE
jgi:hypothetical protein